jgi:hypothetical protein
MTEKSAGDALLDLEHSLIQVDAARNALGSVLDELQELPCTNTVACILHTLDAAAEGGRIAFDIIHKAVNATKE